ncbi:hypothetical protein [Hafnia alvei]|uniref:hypothetical protein n=1 Tax=Hafnia alvei TaxID=569 RepID=UPI0014131AF0|nr:hypothetical protein [Hafnia alvei]QIP54872.1 hypothetical protein HBA19_04200 [Hafnia alvei]
MRYLIFLIFFISASQATILKEWGGNHPRAKVTLDYWGESCDIDMGDPVLKGGIIPYFDCQSYIYGILDAYISIRDFIPKKERVCFPKNITPWQVLQDTQYIELSDDKKHCENPIMVSIRPL